MNLKTTPSCFRCLFLYDREFCKSEEDDPGDSIVYFYPSDVSEDTRIALCGQLMGVTQFLCSSLHPPKTFCLAHDKFGAVNIGQYTLAMGFSDETPDYILERELECMLQLIKFYQGDLFSQMWAKRQTDVAFRQRISSALNSLVSLAHNKWSDPLCCTFHHLPSVELPRSASSLFLRCQQVIDAGQQNSGVIGGVIFYKMKVLSSQLNPLLTYWISFLKQSDSQCNGTTAEVSFRPPVGVKLLKVYVSPCKTKSSALKSSDGHSEKAFSPVSSSKLHHIFSIKRSISCFINCHNELGKMTEKSKRRLSDISQHFRVLEEKQMKRSRSADDLLQNAVSFRGFGMGVGLTGLARYLARSDGELGQRKPEFESPKKSPSLVKEMKDIESGFEEGVATDSETNDSQMKQPTFLHQQERPSSLQGSPVSSEMSPITNLQLPSADDNLEEMAIYVQSHQFMTLVFLMDKKNCQDPQVIHNLWQLGMYSLGDLQTGIMNVEDQCFAGDNTPTYHFLAFDPLWMGLVGSGSQPKLSSFQQIRDAQEQHKYLHELTVRHEDELSYTQCVGRKQIYFQQSMKKERAGLPSPMDGIGRLFTRMKTNLEKEHNVTLF